VSFVETFFPVATTIIAINITTKTISIVSATTDAHAILSCFIYTYIKSFLQEFRIAVIMTLTHQECIIISSRSSLCCYWVVIEENPLYFVIYGVLVLHQSLCADKTLNTLA
jgi:hypothetical protein